MRASAIWTASLALLALLVMGFALTVRVCGASVARASDFQPPPTGAPIVRTVEPVEDGVISDAAARAASEGGPPTVAEYVPDGDTRRVVDRGDAETLELHDLTVWEGPEDSPYLHVSFTPVSIESLFERVPLLSAVVGDEEVEVADVAPTLDADHVSASIDGAPLSVSGLEWYYAGYSDLSGSDTRYMPVCLLNIERPAAGAGEHTISVRIEDVVTGAVGEAEATFECEGWDRQL